jgi:hypothetical protein
VGSGSGEKNVWNSPARADLIKNVWGSPARADLIKNVWGSPARAGVIKMFGALEKGQT